MIGVAIYRKHHQSGLPMDIHHCSTVTHPRTDIQGFARLRKMSKLMNDKIPQIFCHAGYDIQAYHLYGRFLDYADSGSKHAEHHANSHPSGIQWGCAFRDGINSKDGDRRNKQHPNQ